MAFGGKRIGAPARVFTIALVVWLAVFLTQVTTHIHQDGQSETTCHVCQAAHLSSTLPSGALTVSVTPQSLGYVEFLTVAFHPNSFFLDSPSRAPPSFPS